MTRNSVPDSTRISAPPWLAPNAALKTSASLSLKLPGGSHLYSGWLPRCRDSDFWPSLSGFLPSWHKLYSLASIRSLKQPPSCSHLLSPGLSTPSLSSSFARHLQGEFDACKKLAPDADSRLSARSGTGRFCWAFARRGEGTTARGSALAPWGLTGPRRTRGIGKPWLGETKVWPASCPLAASKTAACWSAARPGPHDTCPSYEMSHVWFVASSKLILSTLIGLSLSNN